VLETMRRGREGVRFKPSSGRMRVASTSRNVARDPVL
jgi:hypothetical protein